MRFAVVRAVKDFLNGLSVVPLNAKTAKDWTRRLATINAGSFYLGSSIFKNNSSTLLYTKQSRLTALIIFKMFFNRIQSDSGQTSVAEVLLCAFSASQGSERPSNAWALLPPI